MHSRIVIARPQGGRGDLGQQPANSPKAACYLTMFCEIATSAAPPRNDKSGDLCGRGSAVRKRVPNDKKDRRRAVPLRFTQSIPSTVTFSTPLASNSARYFCIRSFSSLYMPESG